jgi:DNA-binding LacI/PurR family transcriptional regulator
MNCPPIASVEQFPYEQGARATEILLRLIEAKSSEEIIPYEKIILNSKFVVY